MSRYCHAKRQAWKSQDNFNFISNLSQLDRSMLNLVKITENTSRLRISLLLQQKPFPGSIKICKMRFACVVKNSLKAYIFDQFLLHGRSFPCLMLWYTLIFKVLTYWSGTTWLSRRFRPFLPSRMCMGLGLHCVSFSILWLTAQNSQFQLSWLYLGEELVTVCLLSNLFVYWTNTCRAMVACLSKRSQCRSKRKLSGRG